MGDPLGLKAPLEVLWGVVCELRGPDGPLAAVEVRGRSRDTATPEMILIERSCSASRRDCVEIRRSPCRVKRAERRSPVTARAASSTAHGRKADMGLPSRRRNGEGSPTTWLETQERKGKGLNGSVRRINP